MRFLTALTCPCAVRRFALRQSALRVLRIGVRNLLLAAFSLALPLNLHAQTVSYAGLQQTYRSSFSVPPVALAFDANSTSYAVFYQAANITKLAGSGPQTITVSLSDPRSIAVDSSGNLYVADYAKTYIVKVPAGGGTAVQVGSGLLHPTSVAIDSSNDVFIADSGHARIVKVVNTTQTVVAVPAGTFTTPAGIAVDPYGNLYVSDIGTHSLIEVKFAGSTVTVATVLSNLTNAPSYVAVDTSNDVILSGGSDHAVTMYQVPAQLGASGTIRQLGSGLTEPEGVVVVDGYVVVADEGTSAIYLDSLATPDLGEVNLCPASGTQVAPCTSIATLNFNIASGQNLSSVSVRAITGGATGLDFAETNTCPSTITGPATCSVTVAFKPLVPGVRLGAVDISGISGSAASPALLASVPVQGLGLGSLPGFDAGVISTPPLTFQGGPFLGSVIADNSGNLYFADNNNCVIEKFAAPSGPTTIVAGTGVCGAASGDNGPATSAVFMEPWRLALSARGDLYVSDDLAGVIRKIDAQTGIITTVAGTPNSPGHSDDETVATSAQLTRPFGLAFDATGDLYFSDWAEHTVRKIDALSGVLTTVAGKYTLGCGSSGDGSSATAATLNNPLAIAIDSNNALYIADANSHLVRKVDPSTGNINTVAGVAADAPSCDAPAGGSYSGDGGPAASAHLNNPEGLAVDPANNLYIADSANFVVRKVNAATGIITTVGGVYSGSAQNSGAGGAANLAGLGYVQDLAIDSSGNFYLVDGTNSLIHEVNQASGVVSFAAYNMGVASPAVDVALTNNGNATLDLSALTAPANFNSLGTDTTCSASTTLSAGQGCILGIEFQPAAVGSLTGSFTVTDDAGNYPGATQLLALSGTGDYVPTQVALASLPPTLTTGSNLGVVQASIESSGGNVVSNSAASVMATLTGPGPYSQTVTVSSINGVASLDLSSFALSPAGSYLLTAASSGLTSATAMINVVNPPAIQLVLGSLPSTIVASNTTGPITVSVEASNGSTVTTSPTAVVTLTITGPASFSLVQTVAAVSGVATFSPTTLTAPGTYTVTATGPGLTSSSAMLTVLPPPATKVILSALPASINAGGNLGTATATIETATGSIVTTSSALVTLTISGTSDTQTVAAVNGVATFNLASDVLTTVGSYTVTATSTALTQASASVNVVVPPATQLVLSNVPASISAGSNLGTAIVKIETATGSVVTTSSAAVTLTISGTSYKQTVAAVKGVATFNLAADTLASTGSYMVAVTSTGLTQTSTVVTVVAPPATQLVLSGLPSSLVTGGTLGTAMVKIETANGTVVTTTSAPVTLNITGPGSYTQTAKVAANSGVATFDLSSFALTTVGTYTVSASSPGLTSSASTVSVTALPALVLSSTGSSSSTIAPGAAATFSISLAATSAIYSQPASLTASGLPAGATATFSPATLTPGPATVATTLTIQTAAATAAMHDPRGVPNGWAGLALGMLLLPLAASRRLRRAASQLPLLAGVFGLLSIGAVCGLTGCGSSPASTSPAPQSYTITVTGTSGTASGSTTVTLIVQ